MDNIHLICYSYDPEVKKTMQCNVYTRQELAGIVRQQLKDGSKRKYEVCDCQNQKHFLTAVIWPKTEFSTFNIS